MAPSHSREAVSEQDTVLAALRSKMIEFTFALQMKHELHIIEMFSGVEVESFDVILIGEDNLLVLGFTVPALEIRLRRSVDRVGRRRPRRRGLS
mmetsp:Transcript_8976/g.25623  ORF Transcript_8976/g.25623 Transcript_8976/m.25623 type:complete len:94 (+) Transcript_8976:42-323(+)